MSFFLGCHRSGSFFVWCLFTCCNLLKNWSCRFWKCSGEQLAAAFTASSFLSSKWLISFNSSSLSLLISLSYAAICERFSTAIYHPVSRTGPVCAGSMESTQNVNFRLWCGNFLLLPLIFSPFIICSWALCGLFTPLDFIRSAPIFLISVDGVRGTVWEFAVSFFFS